MADETAPLSLDSAVSLMLPQADAPATDATPAPEPEKKDAPAATTDTPADQSAADDTPAASADDTPSPAQDDAPAAADGQDEPGSLPPIEPPSGWKAEEKEVFKTLPRAAQEAIARREQDRTTELRNLQNAAAEQRKAAEGEVARLKGLADRLDTTINDQVNDLAKEFPEIKTQADIDALAASNPARFAQFQAALMRFNATREAQTEAQRELSRKQEQTNRELMASAHKALVEAFPTWTDPKVATKEITELQDYAISLGANEQEARAMYSPVVYKLAQKAMLYDRAQAARAAAVNRAAPPTVKPGASTTPTKADRAAQDRAAALRKLDKTGDIEDALSLMLVR